MNPIKEFLLKNGFSETDRNNEFTKDDNVEVVICEKWYEIHSSVFNPDDKIWGCIYSPDLNIYWLIGVLTYYKLIDKDYKQ